MKSVPEFGGAKNKLTAFGLSKTFTAQKKMLSRCTGLVGRHQGSLWR